MQPEVITNAGLAACGNCGSSQVRNRQRTGRGGNRGTAQVVCAQCGARSELFVGPDAALRAQDAWARRPYLRSVPAPLPVAVPKSRTKSADRALERDPLELVARMLVGGSFRMPSDSRSTGQPLTSADIAGAVGLMRDPVAKQAILAVALRGEGATITGLARATAKRVMRQMHGRCQSHDASRPALRLDVPADRWRMRLVMQDAVADFVWPERKPSSQAAAKAAKMRKGDYLAAYSIAASALRQALEDGRQQFKAKLFAR